MLKVSKNSVKLISCLSIILLVFIFAGCSSAMDSGVMAPEMGYGVYGDNNEYLELEEKPFSKTSENNKVNLSLDSSTAAYSNLRKLINNGYNISKDAVNIEQMLNYFNYSYVNETEEQLTSFLEIADCPWNENNKLLSIAVKAKDFKMENQIQNNFVFLLDVSGSMYAQDKLPLMIEAFKILIDNLGDNDRVSIVTYAGSDQVLLDGGYGHEKPKISAIISDLKAGGSTAGAAGIKTAYKLAEKHFIQDGNNRVFLATDGDFNVGINRPNELEEFISEKRKSGVYLSLFGFGYGNLNADTMDTLAQAGNGNYYYIDSILEAQKVFISELGGTLQTVAKDAKVQVEFNEQIVDEYRVIGYENKYLTNEEFENNQTDAGEIGAGHTTVCLIELKLHETYDAQVMPIVTSTIRYKDVQDNGIDKEIINSCSMFTLNPSTDFMFQASVAEFGLLLRKSEYANATMESILHGLLFLNDEQVQDPYKLEFLSLVKKYQERISKNQQ